MTLPRKLKIVGREIDVEFDKELTNRSDTWGEAHYRYDKIVLQSSVAGLPRKTQAIQITLLHEIVHFILDAMGEDELRGNEKFVGPFSEILYQVLKDNKLKFY